MRFPVKVMVEVNVNDYCAEYAADFTKREIAEAIAADIDSALDVAFGRIKVVEIASVDL